MNIKHKDKLTSMVSLGMSGIVLFAGTVAFGLPVGVVLISGGIAGLSLYDIIQQKFFRTKLDKFFEAVDLQCNNMLPEVKNEEEKEDKIIYKVIVPTGLGLKDFEKHKDGMEHYFRGKVSFKFNYGTGDHDDDNLTIIINKKMLKTKYDYQAIGGEKPTEVLAGYTAEGEMFMNIASLPYLLVAGAAGSGKSVFVKLLLTSLVCTKGNYIELYLHDSQRVEMGIFEKCKYVKEFTYTPEDFHNMLKELKQESNKRLTKFWEKNVSNIEDYNRAVEPKNRLKYIIVVVEEFSALAGYKEIMSDLVLRLSADRKCGISYILTTQYATVNLLQTGIKGNITHRIAFKTASANDSRTILDMNGAEKLRGKGHGIWNETEFQTMWLPDDKIREMIKGSIIDKVNGKNENMGAGGVHIVKTKRQKSGDIY
jgi:S-DNA-T family DNA segregation ATPase FtsK/SpoIIIE